MKETIKLNSDDGFTLSHLSRRIAGFEEAITQAAESLKQARRQHSGEVRAELEKRGVFTDHWGTRTQPDGTVFIDYDVPDEPTPKPRKKSLPK